MFRAFLEEDTDLIRKHFPGAKTVALKTPFDLTDRPTAVRPASETFREPEVLQRTWYGDLLWDLPE